MARPRPLLLPRPPPPEGSFLDSYLAITPPLRPQSEHGPDLTQDKSGLLPCSLHSPSFVGHPESLPSPQHRSPTQPQNSTEPRFSPELKFHVLFFRACTFCALCALFDCFGLSAPWIGKPSRHSFSWPEWPALNTSHHRLCAEAFATACFHLPLTKPLRGRNIRCLSFSLSRFASSIDRSRPPG